MDDIDRELISLLCIKIEMQMEDRGAFALTVGGRSDKEHKSAMAELAQT